MISVLFSLFACFGHSLEQLFVIKDLPLGSAELAIDLLSRRNSSQSDDNSMFNFDANDTLFGDLPEDGDDNMPSIMDTSPVVSLEPIVSLNPIRLPFESTILSQTNIDLTKTQGLHSVTISPVPPIPSKRGPGRPRKDGKVPVQRKNLFPGRPRMRGRKTLNVLGVGSNPTPNEMTSKPSLGSFNMSSGLSIKAISGPIQRTPSESGRVELSISPANFGSQMSSNMSVSNSDDSNNEIESKLNTRYCIFCNLSDTSSLCLGELIRCEPTPGFNPLKRSGRLRRPSETETICGSSASGDNSSINSTKTSES